MATRDESDIKNLLHRLLLKLLDKKHGDVTAQFQYVLSVMGSNFSITVEPDEFQIIEKIKKKLALEGRANDMVTFVQLHNQLKAQNVLCNSWAVFYLLFELYQDQKKQFKTTDRAAFFGLSTNATSTPYLESNVQESNVQSSGTLSVRETISSSGIGTCISSITPDSRFYSIPSSQSTQRRSTDDYRHSKFINSSHRQVVAVNESSSSAVDPIESQGVGEESILRELIFIFQGIDGNIIKYDRAEDCYTIDREIGMARTIKDQVVKLTELGWLHNKVKNYTENRSKDKTFGLVGQSFITALQQELTDYYRLLSVLEMQIHRDDFDEGISSDCKWMLTLHRLDVWSFDPKHRMKWLALLVDYSKDKKGGALCSAIHSYTMHGDPDVHALMQHILKLAAFPIHNFIDKWIYDGQLEDRCHEFFVAADPTIKNEALWHDRYSLRKTMIPSFLNMEQASKILLIGKSINFIQQVCHDNSLNNKKIQKSHSSELLFDEEVDGGFQQIINQVYKDTSQHLLHILFTKYKFLDHLKAMRRYLLLGQGDFIKHLMDLLEDDLAKPANILYLHNITSVLETAIRATNAQYDDPHILSRLDVRLLEVSPGDIGWDVFSLDYHIDGPIATIFRSDCIIMYLRAFNFLWRAKRMEYILAQVWRGQMTYARKLKPFKEMGAVLHQCHILAAEMVYFVQQMQYYINFEVLECAWGELWRHVTDAKDLDHIISAHHQFLHTIIQRCLLDPESTGLLTQLRAIFDLIIQYQLGQDGMYKAAIEELESQQQTCNLLKARTHQGNWGLSLKEEEAEKKRTKDFIHQVIPSYRAQLRVLSQSYQDMVQKLLVMLTEHKDESLRLLAVRLDFNEIYKSKEPKLQSPLKYKQRKVF